MIHNEDQAENSNLIPLTIGDVTVEVDPEKLRAYQNEANTYLTAEVAAKADFKEAVETMEETFGIDKKILTKWLKASFKTKTKETSELAEAFEQLDGVTIGKVG
jgi:multidrug efflux pump subunit AcrB